METEWLDFEDLDVEDLGVEDEERLASALADVGLLAIKSGEDYLTTAEGGGVSVVLVAGHSLREVVGGVMLYALETLDCHLLSSQFKRFLSMVMLSLALFDKEENTQSRMSDPMDWVRNG